MALDLRNTLYMCIFVCGYVCMYECIHIYRYSVRREDVTVFRRQLCKIRHILEAHPTHTHTHTHLLRWTSVIVETLDRPQPCTAFIRRW